MNGVMLRSAVRKLVKIVLAHVCATSLSVCSATAQTSTNHDCNHVNPQSTISISTISPNNLLFPRATIQITGNGLTGHDLIWLKEEPTGPKRLIADTVSSAGVSLTAKLKSLPSRPAPYFLYVENQLGSSNEMMVIVGSSPSPLKVTNPVGGEQWKIGTTHRIAWKGPTKGKVYQLTLQSASAWYQTHNMTPAVNGERTVTYKAGVGCGIGGCSVGIPPGSYYVVVEDRDTAVQAWSSQPITLVP